MFFKKGKDIKELSGKFIFTYKYNVFNHTIKCTKEHLPDKTHEELIELIKSQGYTLIENHDNEY